MGNVFNKNRYRVVCALIVLSLLSCVEEYNPFQDDSNARTHIFKTFLKSDTIPVFTTDSVELLFTVCNLIQKVSLRATNNRYFDTTTILEPCGKKKVNVSFYDTGYQELRIATYRHNGDSVILKKRYYITSDLSQDTVRGYYGDTLSLHAVTNNGKQDKDIQYIWKIDPVKPIKSHYDSAVMIIDEIVKSDSGQLFICDNDGKFYSPAFTFNVLLLDPLPQIVIAGTDSDSLFTSTDSIDLKVNVEKSITPVRVYVNGQKMDEVTRNTFLKKIRKTDFQISTLNIVALDDWSGMKSSRVVYVEFNSKKQQNVNPRLKIMEFANSGIATVTQEKYTISGSVEFNANHPMKYTVTLFEATAPRDSVKKYLSSSFRWDFPIVLSKEKTVFRIELSDSIKNVIEDTTLMINYCKDCIDSVPPAIRQVLVNGGSPLKSGRYVSNKKDERIELIYYDDGGIDSVMMNNRLMKDDSSTNYRWYYDTLVNHILNPDTFIFYAVDRTGNRSINDTIITGYNTPPVIRSFPDSIEHARIGELYTSNIEMKDEDFNDFNDFVTYSIDSTDVRNIFIDEKGVIKWTPEKSDAGFHYVRIKGEDRSSYAVSFSYVIYVSETVLDTVKFVTSRNEFPSLLPCTDSISIPLKVRGGTKPFVFEITDRTMKNNLTVNQAQPYFKWKPNCASDTVAHQFFIVVRDTLRLSDTLWPVITVLPPNREFELKELRWTGSRKQDSALDLSKNRIDTLYFTITDPDNPLYEYHTINVLSGMEKYSIATDSGKFYIPLSHQARVSGRDSLVLNVKDRGNHVKRLVKRLDYGKPPLTPVVVKPRNDTIIESNEILFSWSCSDPDGEALKYHFKLQFIDGSFQINKEVQDTFCTVSGLKRAGVYYWSVIASDSKSSTSSLSSELTCLPPDRIKIDTTVTKLPELIQCKTSIKAPVVIRNGYPPFTFKCDPPFFVDGDSLVWIPDCNKTGVYKINLTVKDSAGNTDSYSFNTSIYGSDSLDLKIVNTIPRTDNKEIDLSNPLLKTVVCTLVIVDPDPSPPENFTIEVFLGNLRQQYFNNYVGRTFFVSLKPDKSKTRDTLSVNVTDIDEHKKNLTEIIYYGE